ncbi:MAG TPA: penicillin-binding protein 1C [Candidatus Kryptonia bacterium]
MRRLIRLLRLRPLESGVMIAAAAFIFSFFVPIPEEDLSPLPVISMRITDRNDRTLREVLSDQGGRAYWLRPDEIPKHLIDATIAAEDRYFYSHPGINPFSIARAFVQDIRSRRFVAGGSTITQQVVRNIYHEPRTIFGKMIEGWRAIRLEKTISKKDIIVEYLNRVPYGNGTYGIEAASRLYFGMPAAHLSLAQSAFLAGLPNSPSMSNPYKGIDKAKRRQLIILKRMLSENYITKEECGRAADERIILQDPDRQLRAPHFTEMVLNSIPADERSRISSIRTTLDYEIQNTVEILLKGHIASLRKSHVTNGSVVVIDNLTGEVIALAGSVDYFDSLHDGQFNGALAKRQPGSALKPFVYGLALEAGMTAAEVLPDIPFAAPTQNGTFVPQNYDRRFHGPVRLRTALGCSYNVPAVRVADKLGLDAVLAKFHDAGLASLDRPASYYGLGLALGDGEVTLLELTRAYSMLARSGNYIPDKIILAIRNINGVEKPFTSPDSSVPAGVARSVFSPQVAYIITSILSDEDARAPAFGIDSPVSLPFPCAVKTGTSKDYKDNWTVGFTPRWTVGVWAGNFDAKPMRTISGITGAGMLFRDVMLYLEQSGNWSGFRVPEGIVHVKVCALSGKLPGNACTGTMDEVFIRGTEPTETCDMHLKILVDARTGEPARGPIRGRSLLTETIEVLPPSYDSWLEQREEGRRNRLPVPGPRARLGTPVSSTGDLQRPAAVEFGISAPENGAVFKIDPSLRREFQMLDVAVVAGPAYHDVKLLVDGKLYAELSDTKIARWALLPGGHAFSIIAERKNKTVRSSTVRITVN